jgi:hypothetical protein
MSFRALFILALAMSPGMAKTLLLLPLQGDLEKAADLSTVDGLYKDVWQGTYKGEVHFPSDSAHVKCAEKSCAETLAQEGKADEVVFSTIRRLGEKWIFSSTIMDAKGQEPFNQRVVAQNIEDMEPVTRRVADALQARLSLEKVATTENITGKEENSEPTRRRSLFITGLSLGYLYPFGSSYTYNQSRYDIGSGYTHRDNQPYSQLVRLAWLNEWEFRDDMALGFDMVWSMPNDIGGDMSLQYLFRKTDFTPFVGGGLGLHYVAPLDDSVDDSRRDSGPTLNAQAGIMLFRTYDIHVIAKTQYQVILNSRGDNGLVFDVGVVYQKRERQESGGGGLIAVLGWTFLGILALGLIGSVSH